MTEPRTPTPPPPLTLTERRKAATQLDIARAAAELFADKGPDGTTAEEIAARAGVALRTFYRYFRNKQDAVGPLLASGADRWRELLDATPPGTPLREALEAAAVASLSEPGEEAREGLRRTRGLLRAARHDPALRAVWYRVNQESEEKLLPVVTRLTGPGADELEARLAAAAATDAIRVALEVWAPTEAGTSGPGSPADLTVRCLRSLTAGF
ncbi:TetR family transcriptional regulator [Streptomyces sp. NPDC052225]|uniref:TetR family transcriptional regulator n=1 Tax=Streptomyces sp. NPDC052225 TaxID=3154949 RepID=UPI0034181341